MSREELEKLPCFDFKAKEIKGATPSPSPADCAVCLEGFKAGEKCRLLPLCCHSFHAECVDMWLLRTALCPICRGSADFNRAVEESSRYVMLLLGFAETNSIILFCFWNRGGYFT
ncbi:unnamed protein product [Coffea canephora]|uniref:RING-type domain-containing protein n=1 Tax=Coffea canephora TaxID=49390 RepID=A0A068U0U1_COFCA|nr:unnamed protein product [Coffea canephora]